MTPEEHREVNPLILTIVHKLSFPFLARLDLVCLQVGRPLLLRHADASNDRKSAAPARKGARVRRRRAAGGLWRVVVGHSRWWLEMKSVQQARVLPVCSRGRSASTSRRSVRALRPFWTPTTSCCQNARRARSPRRSLSLLLTLVLLVRDTITTNVPSHLNVDSPRIILSDFACSSPRSAREPLSSDLPPWMPRQTLSPKATDTHS